METTRIPSAGLRFSRIGLGTWAMGGWMWGGTDHRFSNKVGLVESNLSLCMRSWGGAKRFQLKVCRIGQCLSDEAERQGHL